VKRFGILGGLTLLYLFLMGYGPGASDAVPAETTEPEVKTAFVFNFIKFVDWSSNAAPQGEPMITLCILGQDPLGETLPSLAGKVAQGRKLSVRQIAKPGQTDGCQVLYICKSEKDQMGNVLKGMKPGVLTIGDMKNFAHSGGAINFVMEEKKVSFEINVDSVERAGMKISSQLLKLAKIVKDVSGKGER
jgi:hypothetical protein